jgi:hypothetical protein
MRMRRNLANVVNFFGWPVMTLGHAMLADWPFLPDEL